RTQVGFTCMQDEPRLLVATITNSVINYNQDLRKISLKPSFLRSLRSYAFGTLGERGSLFRDLCVSPNNFQIPR
ncbi:MAG: hypothetical protein ACKPGN_19860, partial [Dolichospermum sp.]